MCVCWVRPRRAWRRSMHSHAWSACCSPPKARCAPCQRRAWHWCGRCCGPVARGHVGANARAHARVARCCSWRCDQHDCVECVGARIGAHSACRVLCTPSAPRARACGVVGWSACAAWRRHNVGSTNTSGVATSGAAHGGVVQWHGRGCRGRRQPRARHRLPPRHAACAAAHPHGAGVRRAARFCGHGGAPGACRPATTSGAAATDCGGGRGGRSTRYASEAGAGAAGSRVVRQGVARGRWVAVECHCHCQCGVCSGTATASAVSAVVTVVFAIETSRFTLTPSLALSGRVAALQTHATCACNLDHSTTAVRHTPRMQLEHDAVGITQSPRR